MAVNYYNEIDPTAALWLRNLIDAGEIPAGVVDERSIEDVKPSDLAGFTQCHFFAGIGGWALALKLAGVEPGRRLWTGSCPCQPFSQAGKGAGTDDKRHLWPAWFHLISQCRPAIVIGEQVASPAALRWFDLVSADLENARYAVAGADLCSAGIGGAHIRQRLYWVAHTEHAERRAIGEHREDGRHRADDRRQEAHSIAGACGEVRRVADADPERAGRERGAVSGTEAAGGRAGREAGGIVDQSDPRGTAGRVGITNSPGSQPGVAAAEAAGHRGATVSAGDHGRLADYDRRAGRQGRANAAGRDHGSDAEQGPRSGSGSEPVWLLCTDNKLRPISPEPGAFPLAYGLSRDMVRGKPELGRVAKRAGANRRARLAGYGNAIDPRVAAEFVRAALLNGRLAA